jgi:CheY-like chemotaxis protein
MKPILIVDDDRDIRESLRDILIDEGYPTVEASDGGEALAYLDTHDAALILLDWNMAPMDAPSFMAELATRPRLHAIPVALLTADSRISKAPMPGFAASLKKPIELEKLFALARQFCGT